MHQIVCRLGLCPRAHWGAYSAPLDPLAGLAGGAPGEREGGRGGGKEGGKGRGREGTYVNITSCFCFMRLCNKIMNVTQHCYNGDVSFLWEKWKL